MTAITLIGIGLIVVLLVQSMVMLRKRARRIEPDKDTPDKDTPVTETIQCERCGIVRTTTSTKRAYKLPNKDEAPAWDSPVWMTCRTVGHKWPVAP